MIGKYLHCFWIDKGSCSFDVCDFVFTEKSLNSSCERVDNANFVLHGFIPVETNIACVDSEGFKFMVEFVIFMGDVEESFRGDTTDIEAGSSEGSSFLDADSVKS